MIIQDKPNVSYLIHTFHFPNVFFT
jgi:hypothetical protein